jgi:hypothetical protein
LATTVATQCLALPNAGRGITTARVDRESRAFSVGAQSSGRAMSFYANDTRRATNNSTVRQCRAIVRSRRSRSSLKSVCPTSADSSRHSCTMWGDTMVRVCVVCMCRAHGGNLRPGSGRAWLTRQTRALCRITRRTGRADPTERYHWQHRSRRHVRRLLEPAQAQLRPASTANLARFQ